MTKNPHYCTLGVVLRTLTNSKENLVRKIINLCLEKLLLLSIVVGLLPGLSFIFILVPSKWSPLMIDSFFAGDKQAAFSFLTYWVGDTFICISWTLALLYINNERGLKRRYCWFGFGTTFLYGLIIIYILTNYRL